MKQILLTICTIGGLFYGFGQSTTVTVEITSNSGGDAMVGSAGLVNTNYGSLDFMNVYRDDQTTPIIYRSFLDFDLSGIPTNAIITSAELVLKPKTVDNPISYAYYVERADAAWEADDITWNNQADVFTSDRITVDNPNSASPLNHQIDVKAHVQNMVNYPYNNHGWSIRLRDESVTGNDYGVSFYSADHINEAYRPKLNITYILPMTLTSQVSHCTNGNTDGAVDLTISGGSGNYSKCNIYRVDKDPGYTAKESVVLIQSITSVTQSSIDASALEPGLYRVHVTDALWTGSNAYNNAHFTKYYYFLVGEEGATTNCILVSTNAIEDVQIKENIGSAANIATNDYANINHKQVTSQLGITSTGTNTAGSSGAAYNIASLMNFNIDFASDLDFSQADLHLYGWTRYYQTHTSSNEATYTAVTSPWDDDVVTWNSRPTTDPNVQVVSPKTAVANGYTTNRNDLIDISPLVEYWKTNPNHGFEMALSSYNHPTYSSRAQKTFTNNIGYVEFSFTVKAVSAAYNESTGLGDIVVNAPSGTLPYTYLLSYDPIKPLDSIWLDIKDSTLLDSTFFFQGKENTRSYTFSGLPSERYYVGIFDNSGTLLKQEEVSLSPGSTLYGMENITENGNGQFELTPGASNDGKANVIGSLEAGKNGGLGFHISVLGDMVIGFNAVGASTISNENEILFGIKTEASGLTSIYRNGKILGQTLVTTQSDLELAIDNGDYVFLVDGFEIIRESGELAGAYDAYKVGFLIKKETTGRVEFDTYRGEFKNVLVPVILKNEHYCSAVSGTVEIKNPFIGNSVYATITDLATNQSVSYSDPKSIIAQLGTGSYLVTYTIGNGTTSISTTSQVVNIGHIIDWNSSSSSNHIITQSNALVSSPNTSIGQTFSTNSFPNTTNGWVSYKVDFMKYKINPLAPQYYFIHGEMSLVDQNNQAHVRVVVSNTGGNIINPFISIYDQNNAVIYSGATTVNATYTIENIPTTGNNSEIKVFDNGVQLGNAIPVSGISTYRVKGKTGAYSTIKDTYVSFCYPIPDQFVKLFRSINGGYYQVPADKQLKVEYDEEYIDADGDLNYLIRDKSGQTVLSSGSASQSIVFGDNRIVMDVSTLTANQFYILEVRNDKNEVFYLRFKVT